MYYASSKGFGRVIVLSCERGDNLLRSIQSCLTEQGIDNAVVLSGVATLEDLNYHYVGNRNAVPEEHHVQLRGAFEVGNVDGFILHGKPHIHFTASDQKRSVTAHLEPDTTALYVAELVLAEILDLAPYERLKREEIVLIQE